MTVIAQARIQTELRKHDPEAHIDMTPEAQGPDVVLRGVVVTEREKSLAEAITRSVPGVASVRNELRAMRPVDRRATPQEREPASD